MVVAVGRGIDRAHGRSDVRPKVRKPLTWDKVVHGWRFFANRGHEWSAVWMGLALSYHLLCRASEIWAYVCVCVFFPFILDFNGRTSRGHTGRM